MYNRTLSKFLTSHIYSVLLLGPRQTGKSTLLRSLVPDLEINFADEKTFLEFSSDPGKLEGILKSSKPKLVFIDEVQRLPSLLNTLQFIIDENKGRIRFLLSGSSARKLRRGQANLLPGRLLSYQLGPLTMLEIDDEVSLQDLMSFGTLPGIFTEPNRKLKKQLLTTYAGTYLKEEIQAEALTKNIEGFSRFLFVTAAKNGEYIDYAKTGTQAGITQKTASRFFEILEDTLIVSRLNSFATSEVRRLVKHPKFYFFDVGVLNGLLNNFTSSSDRRGMLFETFVFGQISTLISSLGGQARFSTYRTESGAEVDFIVETDSSIFAIEVKASENVGPTDLRGLKSFTQLHNKAKPLVIYLGKRAYERDGVQIMGLKQALKMIAHEVVD